MSYTPGPWEFRVAKEPPYGPGRKAFLRFCAECWDLTGALGWGCVQADGKTVCVFGNGPTTLGNARLIESAPELAEALSEAVRQYGQEGGPWNVPSDPGGWLGRARAALEKAGVEL